MAQYKIVTFAPGAGDTAKGIETQLNDSYRAGLEIKSTTSANGIIIYTLERQAPTQNKYREPVICTGD